VPQFAARRNIVSTRALSCGLAALLVLSRWSNAAQPGAGPAGGPLPAPLEGRFDFSDRPSERAALEQAIEATAQRLSFVIRPMARSRLRSANRIAPWVEIRQRGEQIAVQFEGRTPMTAPSSGDPVRWKNEDGVMVTLQYRLEGETLVQVLTTSEGARTNRFSGTPEGGLRLAVEISSPRLPAPLKYVLSYPRAAR
jgi:hypothetical protein